VASGQIRESSGSDVDAVDAAVLDAVVASTCINNTLSLSNFEARITPPAADWAGLPRQMPGRGASQHHCGCKHRTALQNFYDGAVISHSEFKFALTKAPQW
jgi:hypothetical protein